MMDLSKRTKIVCTLGPKTHTKETLLKLVEAGMNVCRLNFSHGTHDDHAKLLKLIREVADLTGEPLAVLQDLQGPKIRVGELPELGIELKEGEFVTFTSEAGSKSSISVSYPALHEDARVGFKIFLDDGRMSAEVVEIKKRDVVCKVLRGGVLLSHKGLNLPGIDGRLSSLSEKDKDDVIFGLKIGVDWVALSFVRNKQDVLELSSLIEWNALPETRPSIMVKIEKPEAVVNFDEILTVADGVMVARGDLGIELPPEKVPVIQKDIIGKCLKARKPVVVATQMLDSMLHSPRPTRAEVSDIANAVIDHADAVMLSNETAVGDFPVEAVEVMAATIRETEKSGYDDLPLKLSLSDPKRQTNVSDLLAKAHDGLKAVVVAALSGDTVALAASYRPEVPIAALLPNKKLVQRLNIVWGSRPLLVDKAQNEKQLIDFGLEEARRLNLLKEGDFILLLAGEPLDRRAPVGGCMPPGETGHVEFAELRRVEGGVYGKT